MDGARPSRPRVPHRVRLARSLVATAVPWLALTATALASTDSGSSSSANPTLIIAALIGGSIGAIWLLKPAGRRRPPPARSAASSTHVAHAHRAERRPPER